MRRESPHSHAHLAPERICALYSRGPHFVRMLRRLRELYPDETILAAVPMSFPFSEIEGLADAWIRLPNPNEASALRRGWIVVRRLRRARCSHVVVMFDSPRLNLIARLCGTGRNWCYTVDGRMQDLSRSLPELLVTPLWQRMRGQVAYLRARRGTSRRSRGTDSRT